jgi:hypothetical protein
VLWFLFWINLSLILFSIILIRGWTHLQGTGVFGWSVILLGMPFSLFALNAVMVTKLHLPNYYIAYFLFYFVPALTLLLRQTYLVIKLKMIEKRFRLPAVDRVKNALENKGVPVRFIQFQIEPQGYQKYVTVKLNLAYKNTTNEQRKEIKMIQTELENELENTKIDLTYVYQSEA